MPIGFLLYSLSVCAGCDSRLRDVWLKPSLVHRSASCFVINWARHACQQGREGQQYCDTDAQEDRKGCQGLAHVKTVALFFYIGCGECFYTTNDKGIKKNNPKALSISTSSGVCIAGFNPLQGLGAVPSEARGWAKAPSSHVRSRTGELS